MRKILLFSILFVFSIKAISQDFSNKGKDFWVGYGYHERMTQANGGTQDMVLYFATDQATNITITIPGNGYTQTLTTPAGNNVVTSATIPKNGVQDAKLNIEGLSDRGIHITSDKPMVAYAHVYNSNVSGATILYPTNTLGKEYSSINYKNWSNSQNAYCWFYVVAVDTGTTTVEITPSGNTVGGWVAGNTYTVSLTQGQVYNVMGSLISSPNNCNPVCTGYDLSGSLIKTVASGGSGCKRVGVFSGSGRISITCTNNGSSSDNYMVQNVPRSAWGKKYLTVPAAGNQANNIYRVCVSDPTTVVSINGVVTTLPLQNNFFYEIAATNVPQLIEADRPIMVAQYFTSQGACGNGNPGDPEMIYLSSVEQNINTVLWNATPNFAITGQYFNVVIPNTGTAISSFRLYNAAGVQLATNPFTPHPQDANYSYLRQQLPGSGAYRIVSDSGFNAIAYGFGTTESYGYNAGTNVKDLYQQIGVQTTYGIETTPSVCTNTPFKFKVSLPYCADSIKWNLTQLPGANGTPVTAYNTCTPGAGGPDSTTIVNGKTIYWYSLPTLYSFNNVGTFPVTLTTYYPTAECGGTQDIDFDLQVSDPPVPGFTEVIPGCYTEAVQFVETTPQTPKATYKWYWDFGDGNTSTGKNPVHTYAAPGTYTVRYASITTPGCLSDTISHQVVIPDLPNATISKNTDTVCINAATIPSIIFTGTDGRAPYEFSYTVNGVPQPPVTSAGATYTLTPPVNTAGQFIYAITNVRNVGSTLCTRPVTGQTDTFTVLPNSTITLTSATGTPIQTVCINTAITDVTYAVGGSGNGGIVTGLPAGVTGTYAGGIITITGTPTVSGVFNFTVSTSGPCANITSNGTLTVTADATLALTSATGTDNQTICINTALPNNITYAVGGSGTGGTVTGLPAGITGVYAGGVITISGTPTVSGTFNYSVTTTGPCVKPSTTGTITVTADAVLTLTSAPATTNQTVCINNAIANVTYAVSGTGTGGAVTGLPAGVTGTYAAGVITITGTPTVSGVFTYTVTTTGPCFKPTATGTITVTEDATLTLTSAPATTSQSLCLNTTLVNITYAVGGSGTGAIVTGLPAGVTGIYAGGIVTISGTSTASGVFNYTVTTTGPCVKPIATGTITIWALPTPDFLTNTPLCETRDISFTDNSNPQVGAVTNWTWNFGDPGSGALNTSTLQNPVHNFSTAGNYTITLSVITNNGCANATPFTRTITLNDRPKAGFIVPEVCINDVAAIFTDTSKIANGTLAANGYEWNFGDGSPLTFTQNGTHLYTLVGSYNVTHVVTSTLGCKDTVTNPIFINGANPAADFSVANAAALCSNDSVAITNLSSIGQGSITKVEIYWDWIGAPATVEVDDFPAPNKVYRHKYPTFQAPLTRPYTIRFVAYSGTLCFDFKNTPITINATPKVQFNNMPDACYDAAPFTITQGSEVGGVPGTFVYSGPGIVNANGLFNPVAAGIGTHAIKYTFTSTAAGCVDTASKTIRVLDTASAKFSFLTPTCQGSATTFIEESTAPSGVILVNTVWDFGDGSPLENHAPGTTFTHNYAAWGSYTVTMYNTSAYGCRSAVKQRTVYVSPIPNTAFAFGQTSVCIPNADVSFINNSTIADGTENAFTYLWNFGDPASGALNTSLARTPAPHHYSGTGPYTVTLTVTSGTGCSSTATNPVNFIHPQPKTVFNFNKPSICIGDNVLMTDATNGLDGNITQWHWSFSDGGTAGTQQVLYTFTAPKVYDVTLYTVNSHGCNSDTLTKPFTVYAYPSVNAGPDRVVLEGGSITIEPIVSGNGLQYLWTPNTYLDNDRIEKPTAKNMLNDITYTLTVTGEGGCTSPSDKMFVKVLKMPKVPNTFTPNGDGINDTWRIEYLDTYPNCKVQVFTRTGQLVFESRGYKQPWNGLYNGKALPFDTYYYIIEPENGRQPVTGYVTIVK